MVPKAFENDVRRGLECLRENWVVPTGLGSLLPLFPSAVAAGLSWFAPPELDFRAFRPTEFPENEFFTHTLRAEPFRGSSRRFRLSSASWGSAAPPETRVSQQSANTAPDNFINSSAARKPWLPVRSEPVAK